MHCVNCGKCCQNLTLTMTEYQKLRELGDFDKKAMQYGFIFVIWGRCPFLSSQNRCEIYNDRPLGCKAYPVVTVDPNQAEADVIVKTNELQILYGLEDACPMHLTVVKKDIKRAKIALQYRESLYRNDSKNVDKEVAAKAYKRYLDDLKKYSTSECTTYRLECYKPPE